LGPRVLRVIREELGFLYAYASVKTLLSALRVARRFSIRTAFNRTLVAFGIKDLDQLSKKGRSFGVISAYRANLPKSENQKRHGELVADLQKAGINRAETFKSHWEDMATKVTHKEKSLFVPHISFGTLTALMDKYDQDAVVFKDPSGSIGIYDKNGVATMAFDPEGDLALTKSLGKDDYSKGRSMSFGLQLVDSMTFRYSSSPITRDEIVKALEKQAG